MKKKVIAFVLAASVGMTALQALRYDLVFADSVEEVTEEDSGETDPDPEVETIEEVIEEDYDASSVAINSTNFPDANFRSYVSDNFDTNCDGVLSRGEISAVTVISVPNKNISDMSGVEWFTELVRLWCDNNQLTSLDVSQNTALELLDCSDNRLTSLEVSQNTALDSLDCSFNQLTRLDVSNNTALIHLYCKENQLTRLDVSNNTVLSFLWCYGNNLTILDISNNPSLLNAYRNGNHESENGIVGYQLVIDRRVRAELVFSTAVIILTEAEIPAPEGCMNMYRLYNPNSGEHFYTSSVGERNNLIRIGWNYEGVGWVAPVTSNTPVYRLYNQNGGEHHYTTSIGERNMLINAGWTDEGIGWYSDDQERVPLYRQYNPNAFANNHNYTTSRSENDWLVSIGWQAEGIGWYGIGTGS